MIEFLVKTILQIVVGILGFIFKCTIGLLISIFTKDYRFKPVVITLVVVSAITAILFISIQNEKSVPTPTLDDIEGDGSNYEKDARLLCYYLSTLTFDTTIGELIDNNNPGPPSAHNGNRIILNEFHNSKGEKITFIAGSRNLWADYEVYNRSAVPDSYELLHYGYNNKSCILLKEELTNEYFTSLEDGTFKYNNFRIEFKTNPLVFALIIYR